MIKLLFFNFKISNFLIIIIINISWKNPANTVAVAKGSDLENSKSDIK